MFNRRNASPVAAGGNPVGNDSGAAAGVTNFVQLAPWTDPPLSSTPLFLSAKSAIAAAANAQVSTMATAALANLTRTMNANEQGVIRGFTLFLDNPVVTSNVLWTLLVGGKPVPGLVNVTILGRAAASISRSLSVLVLVPPSNRVDVLITNVDGGAYNVGADLEGWTYQLKPPAPAVRG